MSGADTRPRASTTRLQVAAEAETESAFAPQPPAFKPVGQQGTARGLAVAHSESVAGSNAVGPGRAPSVCGSVASTWAARSVAADSVAGGGRARSATGIRLVGFSGDVRKAIASKPPGENAGLASHPINPNAVGATSSRPQTRSATAQLRQPSATAAGKNEADMMPPPRSPSPSMLSLRAESLASRRTWRSSAVPLPQRPVTRSLATGSSSSMPAPPSSETGSVAMRKRQIEPIPEASQLLQPAKRPRIESDLQSNAGSVVESIAFSAASAVPRVAHAELVTEAFLLEAEEDAAKWFESRCEKSKQVSETAVWACACLRRHTKKERCGAAAARREAQLAARLLQREEELRKNWAADVQKYKDAIDGEQEAMEEEHRKSETAMLELDAQRENRQKASVDMAAEREKLHARLEALRDAPRVATEPPTPLPPSSPSPPKTRSQANRDMPPSASAQPTLLATSLPAAALAEAPKVRAKATAKATALVARATKLPAPPGPRDAQTPMPSQGRAPVLVFPRDAQPPVPLQGRTPARDGQPPMHLQARAPVPAFPRESQAPIPGKPRAKATALTRQSAPAAAAVPSAARRHPEAPSAPHYTMEGEQGPTTRSRARAASGSGAGSHGRAAYQESAGGHAGRGGEEDEEGEAGEGEEEEEGEGTGEGAAHEAQQKQGVANERPDAAQDMAKGAGRAEEGAAAGQGRRSALKKDQPVSQRPPEAPRIEFVGAAVGKGMKASLMPGALTEVGLMTRSRARR